MFFVWTILALAAAICTSAVESTARSSEKLTQEKCKKTDVIMVASIMLSVLVFMIGYYRVQYDPDLFNWGELVLDSLLNYLMMYSGIYGISMAVIAAIPYAIKKSCECKIAPKDETDKK